MDELTRRSPEEIFDALLTLPPMPPMSAHADEVQRYRYRLAGLERARVEAALRNELADATVGRELPLYVVDTAAHSATLADQNVRLWQEAVERSSAQRSAGPVADGW